MAVEVLDIRVSLSDTKPAVFYRAGNVGDHNATTLRFILPSELLLEGDFVYYIAAQPGSGEAPGRTENLVPTADGEYMTISYDVPARLTQRGASSVTLVVTDNDDVLIHSWPAYLVYTGEGASEESIPEKEKGLLGGYMSQLDARYREAGRLVVTQNEEPIWPETQIWIDPDAEGIVTTPDEVFSGVIGVSGMLKGNGVGAIAAAVPKTDYTPGLSGITPGLLKSDAGGNISRAVPGTDYTPGLAGMSAGMLKSNAAGYTSSATPGTDYAPGYKGIISTGADANNIKEPGIYSVNPPAGEAQIPNLPNTKYGTVKVVLCTGSFIEQEYMDYDGNRFQRFYDMYWDEWKPWRRVITNATPDVVLHAGGDSLATGRTGAHFALSQSMQNFKRLTFHIIANGHAKLLIVPVSAFNAGDNVSWTAARIDATGPGISHYALSVGRANDKLIRISGVAVWIWNGAAGTGPARSDYQTGFFIYRVTGSYS